MNMKVGSCLLFIGLLTGGFVVSKPQEERDDAMLSLI